MMFFSVFILLLLSLLLRSVDSLRFLVPRTQSLGITRQVFTQNTHGGRPFNWYFYNAVVTYSDQATNLFPNDEQVAGLAYQGYQEAYALSLGTDFSVTGVCVLLVGDQAIFASTLRGTGNRGVEIAPNFFYDIIPTDAPLQKQLLECQLSFGGPNNNPHSTNGNCGEILAMQIWHLAHPGEAWPKNAGAKVAFWSNRGVLYNPCNGRGVVHRWGCKQWAEVNGISWVSKQLKVDQFQMSTHVPISSVSYETLWCDGWEEKDRNRAVPLPPSPATEEPDDYGPGFEIDEVEEALRKMNG